MSGNTLVNTDEISKRLADLQESLSKSVTGLLPEVSYGAKMNRRIIIANNSAFTQALPYQKVLGVIKGYDPQLTIVETDPEKQLEVHSDSALDMMYIQRMLNQVGWLVIGAPAE